MGQNSTTQRIFTFWEPSQSMPPYIKLCLQTWEKFCPEYEIVIIDYSTLDKWLSKDFFDEILYSDFSLPKQADAIRCAILYKYGGIWLDADTIITSSDIRKIFDIKADIVMIGTHVAFIKSEGGGNYVLYSWLKDIKKALKFYKIQKYGKNTLIKTLQRFLYPKLAKKLDEWDYLGNSLLNKYLKTKYGYFRIDRDKINAFPENKHILDSKNCIRNYQSFYFENDFCVEAMRETQGIILLHNSWTPQDFLTMSEKEFLAQNNTIANLLKTIL